jgi:hypothetical protein
LLSSSETGNIWFKDGLPVEGAVLPALVPTGSGMYTVHVEIDGCTSALSDAQNIVITGNEETPGAELLVYPNPVANDKLNIELPETNGYRYRINVFDASGRMVKEVWGNNSTTLDLSNCRPGMYNLRVQGDKRIFFKLIVIQ